MTIRSQICEAFDKSQHGHQNQAKLAEGLKKFYQKCNEDQKREFKEEFIIHLKPCLVVFTREPAVERCMDFAARFAALFAQTADDEQDENEGNEENNNDNFYHFLFDYLLENHVAQGKAVRFRICQLVKMLLHIVPRDAALDEELVDRITTCMLVRILDVIPAVRAQAVRALTRLQQPTEGDCPVIDRYLFLMRCDESAEVRAAVLSCITLSTRTLPEVIKRVRDEKEKVRKLAYQVLAQKVSIRALACSRRLHLIEQGLLDQSPIVRDVVKSHLLQSWLRTYQGNILEVLEKLDAVGSYKTTCKAVGAMFEMAKVEDIVVGFTILNENHLVDFENLTPEASLYWCELCRFLREKGVECEHYLEMVLPSLTKFCEYLQMYFEKFLSHVEDSEEAEEEAEEREFIAEQLIKITTGYDLSDDAGRRCLRDTVAKLVSEADVAHFSCVVPALAKILQVLHDSDHENERVMMAAEMIQDARENVESASRAEKSPTTLSEAEMRTRQMQLARIRVKIIETSEELDQQIRSKDFHEAAETQKKLDELKELRVGIEESMKPSEIDSEDEAKSELRNDPATILKCLQIAKEVCSSISFFTTVTGTNGKTRKRKKKLHPTLLELVNTLVLPSVANPIPGIREVAVECLGNCCLYSFDLSAQHLPLFLQIIQADIVEVRIKALGCIVDILRIYGTEAFAPKNEDGMAKDDTSHSSIDMMQEEEDEGTYVTTLILTKIVEMLDEENADVRHAAASGLAMILVSGRVVSPAIFSRLLLLWYNPTTQDEHNTINLISCFLDFYPYMCRANHDCIQEAFLPTLRTLFDAPNSSPLASVNMNNVSELLVYLTKPSVIRSLHVDKENQPKAAWTQRIDWLDDSSAHDSLAVKLSNEILRDPQSVNVGVLSRSLSMLELSSGLQDNLKDLTVLCEQMLENVKNKQALRYLTKFQATVLSLIHVSPDSQDTQENTQQTMETAEDTSQETSEVKTELILPDGEIDENETTFHIQRKRTTRGDRARGPSSVESNEAL